MAGLEGLASTIYHEKQQPGSMLCAQHALNSLLQGHYFTAPDLSDIARNLDILEETYDQDRGQTSSNMDDTGFFSVQVLENALKVWGLNLVRWRSEAMRSYNDRPHIQLAFILNLEQHWFTLRRFGPAFPGVDEDPGEGHWFNLNSSLKAPEWFGKLYLGMVLQQAEADGYSVFVVTQADPEGPLALPRVLADEVAATLPEPTSASTSTNDTFPKTMSSHSAPVQPDSIDSDHFDEEDYELQAALQSSMMAHSPINDDPISNAPPPLGRSNISLPNLHAQPSGLGSQTPRGHPTSHEAEADPDLDPIAQSMERSRLHLQRMQAEQEFAQRDLWSGADLSPEEAQALQERREQRRREEEREEEELRLAIEESERLAQEHRSKRVRLSGSVDEDLEMNSLSSPPPSASQFNQSNHYNHHRVYDDEDAELQAALKASLEDVPEDWQEPDPFTPAAAQHHVAPQPISAKDREDNESTVSSATEDSEAIDREPTVESLDLEEMRRRRLARFGG